MGSAKGEMFDRSDIEFAGAFVAVDDELAHETIGIAGLKDVHHFQAWRGSLRANVFASTQEGEQGRPPIRDERERPAQTPENGLMAGFREAHARAPFRNGFGSRLNRVFDGHPNLGRCARMMQSRRALRLFSLDHHADSQS
jgi:hypothetical protein